ncbi:MAG: hypothetical protein PWR22_1397 [Moorella sp. (in: firmicutes)]|jgi:sporulation-control protein spo0M|uniref:hypothetical protein n=1 Tax=unclassified Neomoorella TaxID=2676739 RepID=UPI0010FFAC14|nr:MULTISPECIES: hypothetical protein [unclassified Moorella (in: firmicutes)]MDK2816768.1 hypothetical protein [Moorella sp. (in: firmicutes)]MDK2893986.1 hypothetical protein [Moorella sp. (in: firmicutes)]GEA15659.1 hypothetical protein E308F_19030 [Moorella sp. E308F]GEA19483.1 hypothetical protein E306M_26210 [Moorella sp. E306M]
MHWLDKLRQVLRLDEEELTLWPEIASTAPEGVKQIINSMLEREKKEMDDIKKILQMYGSTPGYSDPYSGFAEEGNK